MAAWVAFNLNLMFPKVSILQSSYMEFHGAFRREKEKSLKVNVLANVCDES